MGGSGSSGGGGGGSGKVSYPAYMEAVHQDWLEGAATSRLTTENVTAIMSAAIGVSPFSGEAAYDPDTDLDAVDTAVCAFDTVVDALSHLTDWEVAIANAATVIDASVITDDYINADVDAYAEVVDDQLEAVVIPRFEAGMLNINAVMSSAFVIGRSILEGMRNRDVNKYHADLRLKADTQRSDMVLKSADRMLIDLIQRVEFERHVATLTAESRRLRIVAVKEQTDQNLTIAESDARWDLEVFQYGANVLAGIGGGTAATKREPSKSQSAIGGALAGAAIGAQVGGGPGAIAGAVIGLGASLLG